jgi:uncharacterized phage-associated protein
MNELFAPLLGFQSRKAAQIAAYFVSESGGKIEKLKLIKLLYLTDRQFMGDHDRPILYDEFYSLKDGPICSASLNGINGIIDPEIWDEYIARNGNIVVAVKSVNRNDMNEVSNAEHSAAQIVWTKFQSMTASGIRNYTHENCPEYRTVSQGRSPITYAEVFRALGKDDVEGLAAEVENFRQYEGMFAAPDGK